MEIETANREDLPEILALQYLAYQSQAALNGDPNIPPLTQKLDEVEEEFSRGVFLKAVDEGGRIVGSVRGYAEDGTLYIGKLMVAPELQGQGLGTRLLQEMERTCPQPRYELFTSAKSRRNLLLYRRLGYRPFQEQEIKKGLVFVYLEKRTAQSL